MTQRNTEARRQMLTDRRQRQRSLTGGVVIVTEKTPWGQIRANQFPLAPRKPSRNDSAEYRGIGDAGPRRQQAGARAVSRVERAFWCLLLACNVSAAHGHGWGQPWIGIAGALMMTALIIFGDRKVDQ